MYVYVIKIYRTIILLVVLYGCETWSLILRVAHRLRVLENSVEENICAWVEQVEKGVEKTT